MRSAGQLDQKLLALLTLGLVAFGLVMVYSATSASAALGNGDPMAYLERQALYALIGIVGMAIASRSTTTACATSRRGSCSRRSLSVLPCSSSPPRSTARAAGSWSARRAPALRGREARALLFAASSLGKAEAAVVAAPARPPARPADRDVLRLVLLEAGPGDDDHPCGMMLAILLVAGVPVRLSHSRRSSRSWSGSSPAGRARTVARALRLPRSVEGRRGLRLPDRAGDDRDRLRWCLGRRAREGHREGALTSPEAHTDMIFAVIGEELRAHRLGARDRGVRGVRLPRVPYRAPLPRPASGSSSRPG